MKGNRPVDILVGLQWGDEGKGKMVDILAPKYSIVARFQGGPNAGHTIIFEGTKIVLHTLPSGIFNPGSINIIGSGVVIDPWLLIREISEIGLDALVHNLYISGKASLILPTHKILDRLHESMKENKVGTTLKGIGPTYTDKISRIGLKVQDVLKPNFKEAYTKLKRIHLGLFKDQEEVFSAELARLEEEFFTSIEDLKKLNIIDSEIFINEHIADGKKVLAEGAQGSLLDIDFGSYPYVTSSSTIASSACIGLGLPPTKVGEIFGVFKAYCTRVGSGPFPTEVLGPQAELIRERGNEFGATTGRARRVGWLDLPLLKYAIMLSGASNLMLTKADVLSDIPDLYICTHYTKEGGGARKLVAPTSIETGLTPVLEKVPGWEGEISTLTNRKNLPPNLLKYVDFIENILQQRIDYLSTGPARDQTIKLH